MKGYRFEYKCRRCGKVYFESGLTACPGQESFPGVLLLGLAIGGIEPPARMALHYCFYEDGSQHWGSADLVGFVEDAQPAVKGGDAV